VDETGSESCPMAGFGISGAEPSGYATRELNGYLNNYIQDNLCFYPESNRLESWGAFLSGKDDINVKVTSNVHLIPTFDIMMLNCCSNFIFTRRWFVYHILKTASFLKLHT
jgi:hypothetical protein